MFAITPERSEGEQTAQNKSQDIVCYNTWRKTLRIRLQNIDVYRHSIAQT